MPPKPAIPRLNPRVIGLLVLLMVVIAAAVITTDIISPRDRHPGPPATR